MTPGRFRVNVDDINRAVQEKANETWERSGDGATVSEPVVVFDRISLDDFTRWLNKHDGELHCWEHEPLGEDSSMGRVVIYCYWDRAHGAVTINVFQQILRQVTSLATSVQERAAVLDSLEPSPSPRVLVRNRYMEPVMSLGPTKDLYPTIIVHVAYKNQTWSWILAKLKRWLAPQESNVQVAIGVQVCRVVRRMVIMQRNPNFGEGNQQDEFIIETTEFGPAESNGPPRVPGRMSFPIAALYRNSTPPMHCKITVTKT